MVFNICFVQLLVSLLYFWGDRSLKPFLLCLSWVVQVLLFQFTCIWLLSNVLISLKISLLLLFRCLRFLLYYSAPVLLLSGACGTAKPCSWNITQHLSLVYHPGFNHATIPISALSQVRQKPIPQAAPWQARMLQSCSTLFLISRGRSQDFDSFLPTTHFRDWEDVGQG